MSALDTGNARADYATACIIEAAHRGMYLSLEEGSFLGWHTEEREEAEEIVLAAAREEPGEIVCRIAVALPQLTPDDFDPETPEEHVETGRMLLRGEGTTLDLIALSMSLAAFLPLEEKVMANAGALFGGMAQGTEVIL